MVREPDVLIVGGGPAGCAAARLLALWGHRVRLVTRPPSASAPALAESLPPSCQKLFNVLGVEDAIAHAGFVRSTGNTVWWGDGERRVEHFAEGQRGWQVTTDALATVLLQTARAAGADVQYARIEAADVPRLSQSIVLDCTGRAGLIARARGWRIYEPALKTIALVGVWHRDDWPLPDVSQTVIESYEDGWLWSVPTSTHARYIAAMVDPRASNLEGSASRDIYLAEIAKAPRFRSITEDAAFVQGPWGWDASMYSASNYADDAVLLVGDAGSFIDPISSAGVKKALASGWLAAVAAHTALRRPGMRQVAFDFFSSREREVYESFRLLTQRFLTEAAGAHAHPFWSDRDSTVVAQPENIEPAFARLRREAALHVRAGDVQVAERPAISAHEIVLEPRIVDAAHAQDVRYLHGVDVLTLLELAPQHRDVGELFNAYTQRHGPVGLAEFLRVLATMLARGWLVWV